VKQEVQAFAEVNIAWLAAQLEEAGIVSAEERDGRAQAIYAAVAGAQLMARGRSNIALFDSLMNSYAQAGLLPA